MKEGIRISNFFIFIVLKKISKSWQVVFGISNFFGSLFIALGLVPTTRSAKLTPNFTPF